ncbi:hypothetical protein LOC68_00435 [Blastopirellula sp. JC732]|uniref:Uncharacterized protein n=1 Tax=Blastopirellula sediminis TaxID=2894196 RepID=A0A9X1SDN8_9BACT|nr:hypothetical protein [Blastopirellula sediminis]MCC9604340.1 hypothetical protein [Blastopirellula sediminis]MCC9626860.1 hypothetical protein [Blastopirellula sediminis]
MTSRNDNPFASPQVVEMTIERGKFVSAVDWIRVATFGGFKCGGLLGVALAAITVVSVYPDNGPRIFLSLFVTAIVWGMIAAIAGGISGFLVGWIAAAVRNSSAMNVVHAISCFGIAPLVFAGPLLFYASESGMLMVTPLKTAIGILVTCGVILGFYLFWRLRSFGEEAYQRSVDTCTMDDRD